MSNNEEVPIRLALGAVTQDCSNVLLFLMMMIMVVVVLEVLTALAGNLWYYSNRCIKSSGSSWFLK